MARNVLAALALTLLYGLAMRVYQVLRARRESDRWHATALSISSLIGGAGLYAAQQIRDPHTPQLLDIPAFLIMVVAAGTIPMLLEVVTVLRARLLKGTSIHLPRSPHRDPDDPGRGLR